MNHLINGLQNESLSHLNAIQAIISLQQWMNKKYPTLSSVSSSLAIKECLQQVKDDETLNPAA